MHLCKNPKVPKKNKRLSHRFILKASVFHLGAAHFRYQGWSDTCMASHQVSNNMVIFWGLQSKGCKIQMWIICNLVMIKSPDYTKDVYRKLHETAETLANWKFQHKRIKVLDRFNSYIGLQNECYSISVDYSYCRKKSVTAGEKNMWNKQLLTSQETNS